MRDPLKILALLSALALAVFATLITAGCVVEPDEDVLDEAGKAKPPHCPVTLCAVPDGTAPSDAEEIPPDGGSLPQPDALDCCHFFRPDPTTGECSTCSPDMEMCWPEDTSVCPWG